ncbi:hypothetical protein [Dongia rigui]|uniref:Glycosyltransferase RgtA/B/C/D-like domain-containing protein n=1 Tax=Dongia rigui TaxID=940149 RepID=A0ABU5E0G1_9PROT|nr:hypothetical protein [Dongia rigui]MDY0872296.1 hypothetical protein [Dongia rigui]
MTTAEPAEHTPSDARASRLNLGQRIAPLLIVIAYLALLVIVVRTRTYAATNHDVAWLIICAERWLHGAVLGVDLMEINLPGAMLLYVPPVWLADATGLPQTTCVDLWVGIVAVLGAALVARIVSLLDGRVPFSRQEFLTGLLLAPGFALLPGLDFAQRDQFVAILLLPYAILTMAGSRWRDGAFLRHVTAVLAALAICIKPHYVVLLVGGFLVQTYREGWRRALLQTDAFLIAAIGLGYIALVLTVFAPWVDMARSMSPLYLSFGGEFGAILVAAILPALLFCAGLCLANLQLAGGTTLRNLLVYAGLALVLFVVQGKGWEYHALPIHLFLWAGVIVIFIANLPAIAARSKFPALLGLMLVVVPVLLTEWAWRLGMYDRIRYEQFVEDVGIRQFAHPGDAVQFLTLTQSLPFPMVLHEKYVWALRYPALWPLGGIFSRAGQKTDVTEPANRAAIALVATQIAEDIARYRPRVIVVDDRENQPYLPTSFHFLPLLREVAAFDAAWQDYTRASETAAYQIYVRKGP